MPTSGLMVPGGNGCIRGEKTVLARVHEVPGRVNTFWLTWDNAVLLFSAVQQSGQIRG